jgi:hypothetical protein
MYIGYNNGAFNLGIMEAGYEFDRRKREQLKLTAVAVCRIQTQTRKIRKKKVYKSYATVSLVTCMLNSPG